MRFGGDRFISCPILNIVYVLLFVLLQCRAVHHAHIEVGR